MGATPSMTCAACHAQNPEGARFCQSCGAPLAQPNDDPTSLVGQLVGGRYLVKRVIGEGGMGVVYEAEQRMGVHTRRVAIKTLLPSLSADHTIVSRFYRECGVVAQLEHPNTIRIYDFGETPDRRLYIAMEYVQGESLTALIERGPVPVARARHILEQVCGALAEAHALGIVHRDLKPDNIILTRRAYDEDVVKVLDFGIAKTNEAATGEQTKLTQQGVVLGTPPYMSPEQLAGKELDGRSDIYSLGIIAYEMVTGRLPFYGESPWQWATQHMTVPPPPMHTVTSVPIPVEFERAVMHALAKTPSERPATTMELYAELAGERPRAGSTQPDLAPARTSPMEEAAPPERRGTEIGPVVPPIPVAFRTGAAVAAPVVPPLPRRRSGGLGWAIAAGGLLVGGGLATLAAIAHFTNSGNDAPAAPLTPPPPSGTRVLEPVGGPTVETPSPPTSDPPPTLTPRNPKTTPKTPSSAGPLPPPPPSASPPPPPPASQPPPPPPPPSGPQGDAACGAASAAASSSQIESAVALYRQCEKTGGSPSALANARARIRTFAPRAVKDRAYLGNCSGAKSVVNAASSIGEGGPAQNAYNQTSCAGK